jgi:subtilisin family serine protease
MRRGPVKVSVALAALGAVLAVAAPAAALPDQAQGTPGGPVGRYIVVLQDTVADPGAVAAEHAQADNAQVSFVYTAALKGYAAVIPAARLDAVRADPRVAFISDDAEVTAFPKPSKPGGGGGGGGSSQTLPTGVNRIDAEGKANMSGPAVAVIDTGSGPHADLNVRGGVNCNTGASYNDGNGHGTHVAGTIGAYNNTTGVVGVAPGVPIYSVRVLNNAGSGSWSQVVCGIDWVTANAASLNIKVASMSLGGTTTENDSQCSSSALHQAICNSTNAGVTYVVAAGNSNADLSTFAPATYSQVLTVTAMSDSNGAAGGGGGAPSCRTGEGDDVTASFSNYASSADSGHTIAAPGVCILSTWTGGGYNTISGTSMATPHVSGAVVRCIAAGACTGASSTIISKVRADAQSLGSSFTNSPTSSTGRYYGYLVKGSY